MGYDFRNTHDDDVAALIGTLMVIATCGVLMGLVVFFVRTIP
jgi:hypothetical protein